MLPTAQMQHLRDLENEITKINTLPNSSGGIDQLMLGQFQVDTAKKATPLKPAPAAAVAPEDKKRGNQNHP